MLASAYVNHKSVDWRLDFTAWVQLLVPVNTFEKLQKLENEQWIRLENTWVYGQVNRNDYHYAKGFSKVRKINSILHGERPLYLYISPGLPFQKGVVILVLQPNVSFLDNDFYFESFHLKTPNILVAQYFFFVA